MTDYVNVNSSHEEHIHDVPKFNAPMTLSWSNVTYSVPNRVNAKGQKIILQQVSGHGTSGHITAIMGHSGSGKSSLLDILANRMSQKSQVQGKIQINGHNRQAKSFRAITSYVAQEDAILGSFTVYETLSLSAQLCIPRYKAKSQLRLEINTVIQKMGLQSCRNTLVGNIFQKGLSGGQKRRLSIAIELLSNPQILFLDEPTSGLDSSSALHLIKYLEQLCRQENRIVICTIHQPSQLVFSLFETIMFLSRGKCIYFGSRKDIAPYLENIGHGCPRYTSIPEYMLSISNPEYDLSMDSDTLANVFQNSDKAADIITYHTRLHNDSNEGFENNVHISSIQQFRVLFYRNLLNNIRNPGIYWIRLAMYLGLSLMVGTMYLYTNKNITDMDIVALLFYVQAFLVFMSVAVLPVFIEEKAVFTRERKNQSLCIQSYVAANLFASLPGIAIIAILSTLIVVLLANIHGFTVFFLNLFLSLVVSECLMHVISALVPFYIIGITIGAGIFGMFMLCEGFMVPYYAIPRYWRWVYHIAFHSYSFQTFVYEHFKHENTIGATMILERYGMQDVNVTLNLGLLILYAFLLEIIFGVILAVRHNRKCDSE